MKKILFASAMAAAAFVSTSAFAEVNGYAGAAFNWAEVQAGGADAEARGWSVSGSVLAPITQTLSLQGDLAYADAEDAEGVASGAAHLIGNLGDDMRVGAFVSATEVADETALGGGVEGQAQFDRSTLAATVAYATVDELDVDVWGINGEYRYFVTDDFRIDGGLGWVSANTPIGDGEGWSAGVGAEFKPAASNISVHGGWTYLESNDADLSANSFSVGIRYNLGGSLKDRDRTGPSFNGAAGLLSLVNF